MHQTLFVSHRFIVLVLLVGLILSACTSSTPAPLLPEPGPALSEPTAVVEVSPAPVNEPPPPVKPTPRAQLAATDPSQVVLAAGKPQLVEFFAFW
jgi:hypothetical protein